MTTTKQAKADAQTDAIARLRNLLHPGDTVYTALDGRPSASGMTRRIKVFIVRDGEIRSIGWTVGKALGWPVNTENAVKVTGAGMDMGFHLIYTLARTLGAGEWYTGDRDPGYALINRWI